MSAQASTGNLPGAAPAGESRGVKWGLLIGALGVVFGDIGTSPLYTIKECFNPQRGYALNDLDVLGVVSLVLWALILIVTAKYLIFVLRADNHGEGGILALMARVRSGVNNSRTAAGALIALGLCGTALLVADGMITPAISVLSAVEGLEVATPFFKPAVVPVTVVILILLFNMQSRGSGFIGMMFGPIMLVWFVLIAALGIPWIVREPEILYALNPGHALNFFIRHGGHGIPMLGMVVLAVTGAEALYADLGHFGRRPLTQAWQFFVFPALAINYLGQGAILLSRGQEVVANPFFSMVPVPLLYPAVSIATIATVIASQAMISGMFSLARQAIQLGFLPLFTVVHTSREMHHQIYVPVVNGLLMTASLGLVMGFGASSGLASAYGVAVVGTMIITSILMFVLARDQWKWPVAFAYILGVSFLLIDLPFLAGNLFKVAEGAWFPLAAGGAVIAVMSAWKRGESEIAKWRMSYAVPVQDFVRSFDRNPIPRVKGTAVFLMQHPDATPRVLLHHIKHNKMLHEHVVLLALITEPVPSVAPFEQVAVTPLEHGFSKVVARTGFMEGPHVPTILRQAAAHGAAIGEGEISYYLGRTVLRTTGKARMAHWRKKLYAFLFYNERPIEALSGVPANRVVELGEQVEL